MPDPPDLPCPSGDDSGPFDGFPAFFKQTYGRLVKTAMLLGALVVEDAEDIAMAVMYDICEHWSTIDNPVAYARTAVFHGVVKYNVRERKRLVLTVTGGHVMPDADITAAACAWEDRQWVSQLLGRLTPKQQAVMAGYLDGLSTAEIAVALGNTEAAVRKTLQHARARLKEELLTQHASDAQTARTYVEIVGRHTR
jgi:RNA polymerase sigma factor (sigma-70 family)